MKKVLFVATVVRTHIRVFHLPYLQMFKEHGYRTVVAAKNDFADGKVDIPYCDTYVDVPFARNPFSPQNIRAYKKLKAVLETEEFDIVECNTPIAGALARLAARKARKKGTKVVYIAHGFHFFKGGSLAAWLLFYPAEKLLAPLTDVLVTINKEDYNLAARHFKAKKIVQISGIGVDLDRFESCQNDREKLRRSFGVTENDTLLISVGELRKLKNHKTVILAMAKTGNPHIHYIVAGCGPLENELYQTAEKLGVRDRVHLLGFREDIPELLKASDVFCFPSTREGMPVSLTEAMAASLPAVVSDVRGNRDLIVPEKGGYLFAPHDADGFAKALQTLAEHPELRKQMGEFNRNYIRDYDLKIVKQQLSDIYFGAE